MKNLGYITSMIFGFYISAVFFYHAKDVGCDPSPLGIDGTSQMLFFILIVWLLGFLSAKIEHKYSK